MADPQHIAVYLRLSAKDSTSEKENGKGEKESGSLSSQRKLLLDYLREDPELSECIVEEFCER